MYLESTVTKQLLRRLKTNLLYADLRIFFRGFEENEIKMLELHV